tara:strand:- start:2654 stop:3067 length:414 start_codon:yes stop_codon:yes gene_type:complete
MTQEGKITMLLCSNPEYFMTEPDDNFKVLYGCKTEHGCSSYMVDERQMFAGHPGEDADEIHMKEWRNGVAARVGQLRGALLFNCLGTLVDDAAKGDQRVQEFVWRTLHNSGNPEVIEASDFVSRFKTCEKTPDVSLN